jgi:hypothetical protein
MESGSALRIAEGPGDGRLLDGYVTAMAIKDPNSRLSKILEDAITPKRLDEVLGRSQSQWNGFVERWEKGRQEYDELVQRLADDRAKQFERIGEEGRARAAAQADATRRRKQLFVQLVQTRALFHDCQQVMKMKLGESYSALAPTIVEAADASTDEIGEDVGKAAEEFVRELIELLSRERDPQ